MRTTFRKKVSCERLILTHRSHIKKEDASRLSKFTHLRSKRREKIFLFLREEIAALFGAVEKLAPFVVCAICRVSKLLADAGRGAEHRSAGVIPYDLRQVRSTVQNRSEGRNSVLY